MWICTMFYCAYSDLVTSLQVKEVESRLRHKLFPPNAWMKVTDFNVLTSCPKDELHQWFLGMYVEHIIPAMVHRYTQVLRIGCVVSLSRAMMNRADLHLCYSVRVYVTGYTSPHLFPLST